jgi:hypothetical protein
MVLSLPFTFDIKSPSHWWLSRYPASAILTALAY